jgi:hypothetical protein
MSTQPPMFEGIEGISVRDDAAKTVPYSSRLGRYRRASGNGQPVRLVTTKVKKDEILRLLLINKTTREIASEMRLATGTVRDYIRGEAFQRELRAISEPIWRRVDEELCLSKLNKTQRIAEMGDRALEVLADLLESDDERVQARVASDILDRNKETSKHAQVDTTTRFVTIDATKLALAAQTAREIDAPRVVSQDVEGVREGLPDGE